MKFGGWQLVLAFALFVVNVAQAEGPMIPSISIGGNSYSNVTVREVTDTTVTIAHSRGMASMNQLKLTQRDLEDLGLVEKAPPPQPKPQRRLFAPPAEGELQAPPAQLPSLEEIVATAGKFTSMDSEGVQKLVAAVPSLPLRSLLAAAGAYFFLCVCFVLICSEAGKPAPLMVWVPILQMFPLYRAARMSPVWFGLTLFNLVLQLGLIAMIVMQMASAHMVIGGIALFSNFSLISKFAQRYGNTVHKRHSLNRNGHWSADRAEL